MDELLDQFLIEGRELVQSASDDLIAFAGDLRRADLVDSAFRAIHTLKGSTGLFEVQPLGDMLHAAEDLLGALRKQAVAPDETIATALLLCLDQAGRWLDAFQAVGSLPADAAWVGRQIQDGLRARVPAADPARRASAAADPGWVAALVAAQDRTAGPEDAALVAVRYVPNQDCFFTGDDPVAIVRSIPGLRAVSIGSRDAWAPLDDFDPFSCNLVIEALAEASVADVQAAMRLVADQVQIAAVDRHRPRAAAAEQPAGDAESGRDVVLRTLRIGIDNIDVLAGLADEVVVASNTLGHLAAQARSGAASEVLVHGILANHAMLDRLAGRLHRAVMRVRLVPLSSLFRRFPRLVREIGGRLGKELDLALDGETIEVDKSLVDGLFEPLLHLIRNAADHGIETASVRQAAGKPVRGSIRLSASRILDRVVIEVADDGKGIDPADIRRTARDRALLSAEALAGLSDQEVTDLIFTPGFSTATTVTDLSGRGVGLDSVRTAVARLGGRVALATRQGLGTRISLSLPVTIVLTNVVVVRCAGDSFGVPMESVVETVRVAPDRVVAIRSGRAFALRDMIVPLFDLSALLGLPPAPAAGDLKVLVFGRGDAVAAVAVDDFGDRLNLLLRPMSGLLSGMRGLAGTALLGDGRVLMVLDLPELIG
jgi:two-component system, chemotaxis family, sensor kinase CheA